MQTKHYQAIELIYLPQTSTLPHRYKMKSKRHHERDSYTESSNGQGILEWAEALLIKWGMEPVGHVENDDNTRLIIVGSHYRMSVMREQYETEQQEQEATSEEGGNKYDYYKIIQSNYGDGWTDESYYVTDSQFFMTRKERKLYQEDMKAYREATIGNGALRTINRRELKK